MPTFKCLQTLLFDLKFGIMSKYGASKQLLSKWEGDTTDAGYLYWISSEDRAIPKTAVLGCFDKQTRQNQYVGKNLPFS